MRRVACLLFSICSSSALAAEQPVPDKRAYTLANPTPAALLRELTTDRPDTTESPFTVDAGHVQIEASFVSVAREWEGGGRATSAGFAPFNFRVGVRHNLEAAIFVEPYRREVERPRGGPLTRLHGPGNTTLRLKLNLSGNDGGGKAFGVIADVKLPTARRAFDNGKIEPRCTLPVACELGGGWDLGAMTSLMAGYDGARYQPVWLNTISFGHDVFEHVGAFVEITSQTGDGAHVGTFDTGLTWQLDRNLQLDAGVNLGLSRAAPDVTWFVGLSRRF